MSVGSNQMDVCTTRLTKLESGRKPDRKMIKNTDAAMPLCNELEAWCKSQKLPYLRADDLAARGYLTADQKVWIGDFQQRWEALKAGDATEQVSSPKRGISNEVTTKYESLTTESIQLTRQWFADNAMACIAEVQSGEVKVNEPEKYFASCRQRAADALAGNGDHTFAFRQRAYYIQTGTSVPLMTDGNKEDAAESVHESQAPERVSHSGMRP